MTGRSAKGNAVVGDQHVHDQRYEDAMWMLNNGEGFERAAHRLGMTVEALEKLIARHQKRSAL